MRATLTKPKPKAKPKAKPAAKSIAKPPAKTAAVTPRAKSDSPKAQAKYMINKLPDDVTWEQIQYHIYVLTEIAKGEEDFENGRYYTHEEMKKEFFRG